jgi:hypothetical protein
MKTNQIMLREEGFIQRTKDNYFNAESLMLFYNTMNNEKKQMGNYLANSSTKEFIDQLKKEGIESPYISTKGGNVRSLSKSGKWMHPKLFIDFAMWLSVEFKSKVIDMVLDGLMKSRNDAGDYFNEMTSCILETYFEKYGCKPPPIIYINEANLVKSLVVAKDRNNMNEQELRQLTYLQKVNAMLIKKQIGKQARIKRLNEAAEIII